MRQLAERLLALEAAANGQRPREGCHFPVCERLRVPLSMLTGKAGFEALFSRSLALARAESPRLASLEINANGVIEDCDRVQPPLSQEELAAGEVMLVAFMLQLLRTFLGESLMLRLIHDVWPEASFTDTDSGEKTTL